MRAYRDGHVRDEDDPVIVEEPLELRDVHGAPVLLTMRTPGADRELLTGWLHAEGLLSAAPDLAPHPDNPNVWVVRTPLPPHAARLHGSTSACGVCGSGSVERLTQHLTPPLWARPPVSPVLLSALPARLRAQQPLFAATGGAHAAGLFTPGGALLAAFEDVGRHNATDKVLGWAYARGRLPLHDTVLVTSSRAGFEIVQKAVRAGVPVVVTVGAPTSLAVDTAQVAGVTLCGFARAGRLNVYTHAQRVASG
ncbi:formate dehydrogenase accessory sulfurtransferase FdhD [Deinococcus maricopensis]|uniref:Sulfur carrier protein FdhD n=1 Tax=Deinococcus maricopensis (strain DSM 21211 / LMG 22137 / NRRL B-23946 / LB-34) TaxID=709986 RepID=E8U7D5_DEIML|nr:formate dehydrogenase accessory sulfurtransferase FdhD [Deinococcus maricopensis]ADV66974.1 Protein fdhD [Deinococcus maricopensis DSM 21211]